MRVCIGVTAELLPPSIPWLARSGTRHRSSLRSRSEHQHSRVIVTTLGVTCLFAGSSEAILKRIPPLCQRPTSAPSPSPHTDLTSTRPGPTRHAKRSPTRLILSNLNGREKSQGRLSC
ncbi:hypothetical protein E2C01_018494 [Portunus trituberculatus]|uniref:Uncharacterized protein n=1 Tax=Portunus trituberculatus TaxID=210409 RepID=A0A5B7DVS7_PORTR|nr:hypothetical protein [Portunus trituberculatus]